MLSSPPSFIPRLAPPKTYRKFLKHAWRPHPTMEQRLWSRAAVYHLRHQANLRPDAFLRVSDLSLFRSVPEADLTEVLTWVKNDRAQRFEVKTDLERIHDRSGWQKTWYIRAREGHSVPGVELSTTRIESPSRIRELVYATTPENWPLIEKRGIHPEFPPLLASNPSNPNYIYFAQHLATLSPSTFSQYPAPANSSYDNLVQLHIGIDVAAAMNAGIKFFATKTDQIISTGLEDGNIPLKFFKDVWVVAMKREMLYNSVKEPQQQPGA